jgi:rhamnose transport system ATP-binding protein
VNAKKMPDPLENQPPLLALTNLCKSFGAVRALRGVSFDLRAGEVHAIAGENGAGKSTLIKLITGALRPDSGEIIIEGRRIERLNPALAHKLGIACIYQHPALFPDLTVTENLALGMEEPGPWRLVHWGKRRARALELLGRIGAGIDPDVETSRLSMPEQQMVEIARALGAGARVLIMDEPTASLTEKEVALLLAVTRELRNQQVGIIYISHRLEEIFRIADRVTVMRDGQSAGTHACGEINENALIRLMVGREVNTIHPPSENSPGPPLLVVKNLGCRASGVRQVNFELRAGEILGLSGLVGAGRTELARVLFGITPADSGVIELEGRALRIRSPGEALQEGIAYLPEDRRRHGVILEMAVGINITMAIHQRLFPGHWLRFTREGEVALEYIRKLAIKAPGPETRASDLSGGNQQKVSLARWLATHPKVLILDEPTQGVDIGAKAEIHRIMRRLAAQGLGILMISSDLPELLGMSNRIAVMGAGTVTAIHEAAKVDGHEIMRAALAHKRGDS